MYELVYCSKADPNLTSGDMLNILKVARDFNSKNNITGCLLIYNNQIIQIIEGEQSIIQKLFKNIKKDTRHNSVLLLSQVHKDERHFPNWSMAFQEIRPNDFQKILEKNFINNFTAFADLAEKPTLAIQSFWSIVKEIIGNED